MGLKLCRSRRIHNHDNLDNINNSNSITNTNFNYNYNPNNDKLLISYLKNEYKQYYENIEDYLLNDVKFYVENKYYNQEIIITNINSKQHDFDIFFKNYINLELLEIAPKQECSEDCSICLENFNENSYEIMTPIKLACGHIFHYDCINKWYFINQNCPICRKPIHEILN